jgi:hypothetical protein
MATYRPISLIACFPKICEILIYLQTLQHIDCHYILVCEWFGFRKGLSLDSATYKLIEIIRRIRWTGDVACIGEINNIYTILNQKLNEYWPTYKVVIHY